MRSITVDTNTGIFEGKIELFINDKSHLTTLIKKLEKVEGVARVTRFDNQPDDINDDPSVE